MKKRISLLLALLMLLALALPANAQEEPLQIVATIFPAFDFAREIAGGNAQVSLLLPPGTDSHSFDPTPQDILAIQNADLFIYNGGESDVWVARLLESLGDDAPETFVMMEHVDVCLEAEGHDHHDHDHDHDQLLDEHVWTSPRNVMTIAQGLTDKLCLIRPELADAFRQNNATFQQSLTELDAALAEVTSTGVRTTLVFGDRFPFRHLAHAYGLDCHAAFPGCSEDSEPSIKTIASLVKLIREENIPVIFHIEFSNTQTAGILAEETDAKIMLLHSCHTVSQQDIDAGATYLGLMWQNVDALKEALN